jgi:eukaryotic-like serine/threonine-protein kinase
MAELHLMRSYDAEHRERLVVVKRLHPQLAIDPEFVRMFLDEARIASTLHHANVVQVYEIGEHAEPYYIAMEHLHGHDLRDTMARLTGRRVRVGFAQALSIARAVASGLHYTHERTDAAGKLLGIVHRDVSPHNVLLTYSGGVKIVDFGIAKASSQLSRTRTGVLKGKVAYMSPEQAMGEPLDRRSDVFCIGILLWEMTTGRWLYRRRTELDTLNAVVDNRPPRPSRVVSEYPRDLEKLVMKTL